MTRDEAIAKVMAVDVSAPIYGGDGAKLVDKLEALGLLKLEEPTPEWHGPVCDAIHGYHGTQYVVPMNVIHALEYAGLRVVPA